MKVIIITTHNPELIGEVVTKAGHAVVAHSNDHSQIQSLLAEHTPHVCFVEQTIQPDRLVDAAVTRFPGTRIVFLGYQRGSNWTQIIRATLAQGPPEIVWQAEEPERREIIRDIRYFAFAFVEQLAQQKLKDGTNEQIAEAKFRLAWMLHTAGTMREPADLYREAAMAIDGSESQEAVYRTTGGSCESVAYARDILARYATYLAHFVPGADIDCFAPPVPQPAGIRFMHFEPQMELRYALFCLGVFGFNLNVARPLLEVTRWRFVGTEEDELTRTALTALGLVLALKMVVHAHATAIGWLTNPKTVTRLDQPLPRVLRRSLQIFRDFWGFGHVLDLDNLKSFGPLLNDLHANPPREPLPQSLRPPTFAEFHQTIREIENFRLNPNQNPT